MSASSVPVPSLGPNGYVLPDESDILTAVQSDMSQAFGGKLNPSLNTPQGQMASSTSAIIADCYDQFAFIVNQIDPQYATGRMQDAIANIYFLQRDPATSTVVECTLSGLFGTVIPVNAQAQDTAGNLYVCTGAVTIPIGGTVAANFAAVNTGPQTCPAGTLNKIYITIPGWDSITNAADGVPGSDVESASAFAYRMAQSVAINATGSLASIYAALFNVANVLDVYCTENYTDTPVTIGDQTLAPHSLWACVLGGASADIAQAIFNKKSVGCNYNGNNPTIVYDQSGYVLPYPQYTVNWWTATLTPVLFAISIANTPYLPANAVTLIQNAIVAAFAGQDGGPIARIGALLYASRYYAPVLAVATPGTSIEILSLQLGIAAANQSSVQMGIDQKPTISTVNIVVTLV